MGSISWQRDQLQVAKRDFTYFSITNCSLNPGRQIQEDFHQELLCDTCLQFWLDKLFFNILEKNRLSSAIVRVADLNPNNFYFLKAIWLKPRQISTTNADSFTFQWFIK